jgi:hypothetical protein
VVTITLLDITIACADCGRVFDFSGWHQQLSSELGFAPPTRCAPCRRTLDVARSTGLPTITSHAASAGGLA